MRILVTGAAGLIGRATVRDLILSGHEVVGFDKNLAAASRFLPADIRQEVAWLEGDTRDDSSVRNAIKGCDAVMHLAAGASFLMYEQDPVQQTSGVVQGFHVVLEAARRAGVGSIVFASTSAVYEHEKNVPPYVESDIIEPPDLKALAKKFNEEMANQYSKRYGLRVLALRPFSTYGTQEMPKQGYANVISLFTWAVLSGVRPIIWGDGRQARDFTFVTDVARAFVLAVESDLPSQALNVGTGVFTTYSELAAMVCSAASRDLEPIYWPVPVAIYEKKSQANMERTRERLGFTAEISLARGIDLVLEANRDVITSGEWPDLEKAQEFAAGLRF